MEQLKEIDSPYVRLELATDHLYAFSQFLVMNALSLSMLGINNDTSITDARKSFSKAIFELEKVYTNYLDTPFEDYRASLQAVSNVPELERYALIRKAGLALNMLMEVLGENHKWKWAINEMHGRLAVVAKNTLDLKTLVSGLDPRFPHYQERIQYLNLTRKLLQDAADHYRWKYEGVSGQIADFQTSIFYLSAMYRLSIMLGRNSEAENLKRKIDIWKEKLNKDLETRDKKMSISKK